MRFVTRLLASLLLLAGPLSVRGVEVKGLLGVEVPVSDRTPEDQKVALQEGLRAVLIRLSGRSDIGTSTALSKAFADPAKFATRLGLVETPKGDVLRVAFDRGAMVNLLAQSGLPVWSTDRPQMVLWVMVSDGFTSDWLTSGSDHALQRAFNEAAEIRGVPLVFPIMDFDDTVAVSLSDLSSGLPETFIKAGLRYDGEVALTGRVDETLSGSLTGVWSLIQAGGKMDFAVDAPNAAAMVEKVFAQVVPVLSGARRLTGGLGTSTSYRVVIDGIDSLRAYAETLAALANVSTLESYRLETFDAQQLSFRVQSALPYDQLVPALTASGSLQVEPGDSFGMGTEQIVRLRWWPQSVDPQASPDAASAAPAQ